MKRIKKSAYINDKTVTYHIEGWYLTMTEDGSGNQTFSDLWDFENDIISSGETINLYPRWVPNARFTFSLYYKDENNADTLLLEQEVNESDPLSVINAINLRSKLTSAGYTSLNVFRNADGEVIDEKEYKHPGGTDDLDIKVYVDVIKGTYNLVKTALEFKQAVNQNKNVYLMNDIDMSSITLDFDDYKGVIEGHGYKLSNINLKFEAKKENLKANLVDGNDVLKDSLFASIFTNLDSATINNITFENINMDIKASYSGVKYVYFAPLACVASNSKISNVSVTGAITISKLSDSVEVNGVYDSLFYQSTDNTITDSNVNITYSDLTKNEE